MIIQKIIKEVNEIIMQNVLYFNFFLNLTWLFISTSILNNLHTKDTYRLIPIARFPMESVHRNWKTSPFSIKIQICLLPCLCNIKKYEFPTRQLSKIIEINQKPSVYVLSTYESLNYIEVKLYLNNINLT